MEEQQLTLKLCTGFLCPEPVLKRGQFLYGIMVESQASQSASLKRLKQPYLHLLPKETQLHLRLGGWETVVNSST